MRYDNDRDSKIRELKHRYNRRFRLALHLVAWLALLGASALVTWLGVLPAIVLLTLIPHALVVAYQEYQDWLKRHLTRKVDHLDEYDDAPDKRKRYESDADPAEVARFRLTDDGEIEPVSDGQMAHTAAPGKAKRNHHRTDSPTVAPTGEPRAPERRRRDKRRRDDDTDEFNVRALLKKLKDLVD